VAVVSTAAQTAPKGEQEGDMSTAEAVDKALAASLTKLQKRLAKEAERRGISVDDSRLSATWAKTRSASSARAFYTTSLACRDRATPSRVARRRSTSYSGLSKTMFTQGFCAGRFLTSGVRVTHLMERDKPGSRERYA
jgi:hypothetical protein